MLAYVKKILVHRRFEHEHLRLVNVSHLEDTAGLLVDETADALDSTTAGQTADGWLGDSLDVFTQDLVMSLGASLSESLSSFAASKHVD